MKKSEHDRIRHLLREYLAGTLGEDEWASIDAHVSTCMGCAAEIEALSAPPPPPSLRERLLRSLRGDTAASRVLIGGAVIVVLAIIGFVIAGLEESPQAENVVADADVAPAAELALSSPKKEGKRYGIPKDDTLAAVPSDEPAIFFPEARPSDHNESADAEDYKQMKGTSANFLSYIRGEAGGFRGRIGGKDPGVYDTMGTGVGGGGGGRYGGRLGGSRVDAPTYFQPDTEVAAHRGSRNNLRPQDQVAPAARQAAAAPAPEEAPQQTRKIIRSGEIEFEIDSFDGSVATLTKIAVEEQGFIATVNSEKLPNGKVRGTVVVRVPPDRLDTLLLKLRALGDLKSQRIGSADVTKQYTDLESRLRAARTMEERLIKIIKDGKGEIKDLLQAEKELGEWRTRIETMVGEINYYNNLIAHSTITITLYEREIRAPFALVETERVEMGIEVEDVEKAHRDALAAVAEAKGRVTRSELKQLNAGQFNAIIQFEVAPAQAGPLRDRLKQLGVLARLDINRTQEQQGGSGRPQDLKVQQNDTQVIVSIYNLANIAPREVVNLNLASTDAEKSYAAILERVERASGIVITSNLLRQRNDQTIGTLQFHIKAAEADAVLQDIRGAGEVMRLEVTKAADTTQATRSKRGFNVNVFGLGTVQPRETATIVLASKDVAQAYRGLLEAARAAEGRVTASQLNENDRLNVTATLSVELRREQEKAVADAMEKAGSVYTRTSTRAQDMDNVVDSKILLHLRLFDIANIPARETVKLTVEVDEVERAVKGIESDFKGRIVDSRHSRNASGRRESLLTIDVPLREAAGVVERIKGLGSVLNHVVAKNAGVPNNDLAMARLEVTIANEVLVAHDSGPWANIKRGVAISLQAASWSLMLIMIGLCFVLPLVLLGWGAFRLHRRFRAKPAPAA